MAIVTLTSDLGSKDFYVASVKGALLSKIPDVTIVDISHEITNYNILEAAFVLKNAYAEFPKGSIHIIGVLPELTDETSHVLVSYKGHYFISADNGVFSLIFEETPDGIFELNITQESNVLTFPVKDIFVKAAAHIARGGIPEVIGTLKKDLLYKSEYHPSSENNMIKGDVIYVDSYGNIITNIDEVLFKRIGRGRDFIIGSKVKKYDITKLCKSYKDVPPGERLALFGSSGFLEIAINIGSGTSLLGLKVNDTVRIDFIDE